MFDNEDPEFFKKRIELAKQKKYISLSQRELKCI